MEAKNDPLSDLLRLLAMLKEAEDECKRTDRDESSARIRHCAARNRLNEIQKGIDGAYHDLKTDVKTSCPDSTWGSFR